MEFIVKIFKFGIVGILGMVVDFSTTWLIKEKLGVNKFIANSIGFTLAASSNYVLNRIWTFESANKDITKEYISFLSISVIGLGLNNFIIYLIHERMKWNFYFAKIIATGIVVIWNFLANYYITFN